MPKRPTISAVYIVKNEEEYFPYSLKSIERAVDEVIVIDNGSTDRTPQIARSLPKAKLFFSENTNFGYLRNEALKKVETDWFLWIDADEVYYNDFAERLPLLLSNKEAHGYICWYYHLMRSYYYMQNKVKKEGLYKRISIIKKLPGVCFANSVHETLQGLGPNIYDAGLHFVHYGYTKSPENILERWKLYARLEGMEGFYNNYKTEDLLRDRPLYPFRKEHPEVIREYVANQARFLASQGNKLYRELPAEVEEPAWID